MLKLEHFEYMLEVSKTGSISKAACALYISQPHLSQSLKELEAELGVCLLERSNRGAVLTPAGEQFVEYARQVLQLVEKAQHLSELGQKSSRRLAVSSIYSFTMLDLFESFIQSLDSSSINDYYYEEIPNHRIPQKVAEHASDLGLIYLLSTTEDSVRAQLAQMGLNFQPLCQEPLYAVVGRHHPLAGRSSLALAQLRKYPLLVEKIKGEPSKSQTEDNLLFPHLFVSNTKMPIVFDNNRSLMYYLTKSERCFSVGQKSLNLSNPFYRSGELEYIPVSDAGVHTITGMIWDGSMPGSPLQKRLMESLVRFFGQQKPWQP